MSGMLYDMALYRELDELPTLTQGQADDLKIDTRELGVAVDRAHDIRVWTHRPTPGYLEAERYVDGRWVPGTDDDIAVAVDAARSDGLFDDTDDEGDRR